MYFLSAMSFLSLPVHEQSCSSGRSLVAFDPATHGLWLLLPIISLTRTLMTISVHNDTQLRRGRLLLGVESIETLSLAALMAADMNDSRNEAKRAIQVVACFDLLTINCNARFRKPLQLCSLSYYTSFLIKSHRV